MSNESTIIPQDKIFKAAYNAFKTKFTEYEYDSSKDAVAIFRGGQLIARMFFLIDLSKVVRGITLHTYTKGNFDLFDEFFRTDFRELIKPQLKDFYEKADLQLTRFTTEMIELSDAELKLTMSFIPPSQLPR